MKETCVYSFVNLKVLRSGEHLATAWIRTWKRFLTGVDAHMVDKFVLGFERLVHTLTATPVTGVIRLLSSTNMIDSQVCYELHH